MKAICFVEESNSKMAREKLLAKKEKGAVIEQDIKQQIKSGILKPGDRIRPENELAEIYNIGLHQVRKAARKMKREGLLYSIPKVGVFVSDDRETKAENLEPKEEGFHLFDVVGEAKCKLKFPIAGWNHRNRYMWEQICNRFSTISGTTLIEPVFPRDKIEYELSISQSDVFISTPGFLFSARERLNNIELFSPKELEDFTIEKKYLDSITYDEHIIGIPISGTILTGTLNRTLIPPEQLNKLISSSSWEEVFEIVENMVKKNPTCYGINIYSRRTLNILDYLIMTTGGIVNKENKAVDVKREEIRHYLKLIEKYRDSVYNSNISEASQQRVKKYCVLMAFTCKYNSVFSHSPHLTPWLFPLGKNGRYIEGLNIGVVSKNSRYIEESKKFLLYLFSDYVQEQFNTIHGEHPVSKNISDVFKAYPLPWRKVLRAMKEHSTVPYEVIPGYSVFLDSVFTPAIERFFDGALSISQLIEEVQTKTKRAKRK